MKASEQTLQQVERALRKVAAKFPQEAEHTPLTDILLQANPDSGKLQYFNDFDGVLSRCVVVEWMDCLY